MQSRIIKYRAWDADRKVMIYDFSKKTPALFQNEDKEFFCGSYQQNGDWQEPTLMQYTGLKDKNGNEIYEGDIMEVDGVRSFVVFSLDGFRFNSYMPRNLINNLYEASLVGEVVGNMHENPELLKS